MKYIIVLGDGMADEPIEALQGKTPLEYAKTEMMDSLSKRSEIGLVRTVPRGMKPGSDTANLAVLGYNPKKYYTGRSPLEALSIGVDMETTDVAIRCNIVTLSEEEDNYDDRTIIDHSAGEISTEESTQLLEAVKSALEDDDYKFYAGTSFRHLLIWKNGKVVELAAPHDHLTQKTGPYLPEDDKLRDMMCKSYDILKDHPVNLARKAQGKRPGNSIWFWGPGTRPVVDSFEEKTGKKGAMISAVDLLKGIAVGAKMKNISVEGADGSLHTNYEGKAAAAVKTLVEDGSDFVYVHIEAPDEMGHQGNLHDKLESIEYLDARVIRPIYEGMKAAGEDFRMLVLPDHPTPLRLRTHVGDPVPYMLYDSTMELNKTWNYNEKEAKSSGNYIEDGYTLIDRLFEK